MITTLLLVCGCRKEHLPYHERWCRDGYTVHQEDAMPPESVCDRHGGVIHTLTVVEGNRA